MRTLLQDVRYGLRMLRRRPGFTAVAVVTLALGVGVNTALFTIFNALALRPLPLTDPQQLVNVKGRDASGAEKNLFSYQDYLDYRARSTSFKGLAAMNKASAPLGDAVAGGEMDVLGADADYAFLQIVSANYFDVLGAPLALGRAFLPEECETPGARPVIVLSDWFWRQHFNADANVLGKILRLRGENYTIVGVTARGFVGTSPDAPAGWVPLMMRDQLLPAGFWNYRRWLTERDADSFALVGRLKPNVTRAAAQAELSLIAQQLARTFPGAGRSAAVVLTSGMTFINLTAERRYDFFDSPRPAAIPAVWASASVRITPGTIGSPGKCPCTG